MPVEFNWREPFSNWLVAPNDATYSSASDLPQHIQGCRLSGDCGDFDRLIELRNLVELHLIGLSQKNSAKLRHLSGLRRLYIRGGGVAAVSFLDELCALESLYLWQTSRLKSLVGLENASHLKMLVLFEATSPTRVLSLEPVSSLGALEYIELRGPMKLESLSPVSDLATLKKMYVYADVQDKKLTPLLKLKALECLEMWKLDKIFPLDQLAVAAAMQPSLIDVWFNYRANAIGPACKKCGSFYVVVPGRGVRTFCPKCSTQHGKKLKDDFLAMVQAARPT